MNHATIRKLRWQLPAIDSRPCRSLPEDPLKIAMRPRLAPALQRHMIGSGVRSDTSRRYTPVPALVTFFLWLTRGNSVTWLQALLSLLLLQIAWGAWIAWKAKPAAEKHFPIFACIAGMFWLAYGVPLFWSRAESWRFSGGFVTPQGIVRAQLLALLGVASIYAGMHLGAGRRLRRMPTLHLRDSRSSAKLLVAMMLMGTVVRYFPSAVLVFGASLKQVLVILVNIVPLIAYAIMLRRSLMRPVPGYERAMLVLFVATTFLTGLSTGWIGTGATIIMVTGCVVIDARHSVPKAAIVAVFAYVLFLQPAKEEFRANTWYSSNPSGGDVSRAANWLRMSRDAWESALVNSDTNALRLQIYSSMNRFSLLQPTANVVDLTPAIIPHQGWKMYTYMATTLIPRVIWRDKPTVNDANRLYQVLYGITSERGLDGVSISVGVLAESYISFGWFGAAVVMMFIGLVFDCLGALMLSRSSGVLMKGVGFALLPGFVALESQMSQYLGGVVQNVCLSILILLPVAQVTRARLPQRRFARRPVRAVVPSASSPLGSPTVISK